MKRTSILLLSCSALCAGLLTPLLGTSAVLAQAQAEAENDPKNPTVQTVWRVRYDAGTAKTVLLLSGAGLWEEYIETGGRNDTYVSYYVQTGSDATSIDLLDLNRDIKIKVDLSGRTITSLGGKSGDAGSVIGPITDLRGLSTSGVQPAAPKVDIESWVRSPIFGNKQGNSFVLPVRDGWNGFTVYAGNSINTIMSSFNPGTPTTKADVAGPYGGVKGEFKLQPGERITGFSGTYNDDDTLRSLQITTVSRQSQVFGVADGQRQFRLQVPRGHRLVALTGRAGGPGGGINALGIATVPIAARVAAPAAAPGDFPLAGAAPALPVAKFEGVWVRDPYNLTKAPAQNNGIKPKSMPTEVLNGTWMPPEYYVIRRDESDATGMTAEMYVASAPTEVATYVSKDGEFFQAQKPAGGISSFAWSPEEEGGAPRIRFGNGTFVKKPPLPNQELKRTVQTEKVSQEDAWLVDKIPLGLYFNFAGYDITKINPFVLSEHFMAPVFAPGTSQGYEFQDRKIVPHGLQYRQQTLNETFFSESAISSEKEMQESSSFSIGLNVAAKGKGEPPSDKPKAAGGINYAKSQMSGTSDNKNSMRSFGVIQIHDYVLILDQGHMKLSTGFLNMVADIRANRRPVSDLFEKFGTHYPNAVTYGAAARASMRFDASDVRNWASNKESVSASVTIPVKAMEITPSFSSEKEKSESNRMSSSNKVERFSAVGGNAAGSINSFQADANRVVPVLFDLRPIHELINPIHFDDPEVLGRVRSQVVREWNARFASINLSSDESRQPRVFEFKILGLSCDRKGDALDMYGSIKLTFPDEKGPQVVDIMNGSSFSNPRKVVCDSGRVAPGTEAAIVTVVSNGSDVLPEISVSGLNEADLGNILDPDDRYVLERNLQTSGDGRGNMSAGAIFKTTPSLLGGPRVDTNSGSKLILRYTFRELELP
jgi:hypothetical protein